MIVERGLAESREKAQVAIMAGDVLVNGEPVVRAAACHPEGSGVEGGVGSPKDLTPLPHMSQYSC